MMWLSNTKKQIKELIAQLEQSVLTWENTSVKNHERGGREFLIGKKELGHIHWNGELDILFNRKIKNELLDSRLVEEHKWVPNSGWTTYQLKVKEDVLHALRLLELSYQLKSTTGKLTNLNLSQSINKHRNET